MGLVGWCGIMGGLGGLVSVDDRWTRVSENRLVKKRAN